jgi:hypothetical protein
MANKYDLKTWVKRGLTASSTASNSTNIGGSVVPAGMTRFLTYIRVNRRGINPALAITSLVIAVGETGTASTTAASLLGADYLKLPITFVKASKLAVPETALVQEIQGSIEHPILSIAAGNYGGIAASKTNGQVIDIFAQYYDE